MPERPFGVEAESVSIQTNEDPNPCPAPGSYEINASGGTPPYSYKVIPPSPPGTTVSTDGRVTLPQGAQPDSDVTVRVKDSSNPQERAISKNTVA